jgi:hypothetical protein
VVWPGLKARMQESFQIQVGLVKFKVVRPTYQSWSFPSKTIGPQFRFSSRPLSIRHVTGSSITSSPAGSSQHLTVSSRENLTSRLLFVARLASHLAPPHPSTHSLVGLSLFFCHSHNLHRPTLPPQQSRIPLPAKFEPRGAPNEPFKRREAQGSDVVGILQGENLRTLEGDGRRRHLVT